MVWAAFKRHVCGIAWESFALCTCCSFSQVKKIENVGAGTASALLEVSEIENASTLGQLLVSTSTDACRCIDDDRGCAELAMQSAAI